MFYLRQRGSASDRDLACMDSVRQGARILFGLVVAVLMSL